MTDLWGRQFDKFGRELGRIEQESVNSRSGLCVDLRNAIIDGMLGCFQRGIPKQPRTTSPPLVKAAARVMRSF
jgi:hypothetical protein